MMHKKSKILYDGGCELCKSSVQFIDKHGGKGEFDYIPLQSEEGQKLLKQHGYPAGYNESVLLIDNDKVDKKSDSVLEILHRLKTPWSRLYRMKIIPRPLRDFFYNLVSRYRHKKIVQTLMRKYRKSHEGKE